MSHVLAVPLALCLASADGPLRVGFATADITPPARYRMAGGYTEVFATGAADPLFAKATYFEHGDTKAALVVCDVCGHERGLTDAIRAAASRATGVPVAHISVTATHTHGGPMHYDPVFVPLFRAKYGAADDASDPKEIGQYRRAFVARCADAVAKAQKAARPVALSVGVGRVPGVAFNRRYHMADGSVRFNPGKLNPGIVRAAGPTDDTLPVLLAADLDTGKPVGSLTAFAMHVAVYGGRTFSADYPGHLQRKLRDKYGPEFVSVFGEGCAGDVNHVNTATKERDPSPEAIGAALAERLLATAVEPVEPAPLAVKVGVVKAPLRADRSAEVPAMRARLIGDAAFVDKVEAYQVLLTHHLRAKHGDAVPLEVHAFRLAANVAVVTLPHEVFVEFGLQIKKASPFRHTIVLTIANEVDCYVPTRKAFAEGSYEVTNSPYQPGVGELLADEAERLLKALK